MANIGRGLLPYYTDGGGFIARHSTERKKKKKKKKILEGQDEETKGLEVGRCPGCRCYKYLRTARRFSIMYKYIYELRRRRKRECDLWFTPREAVGRRKYAGTILTVVVYRASTGSIYRR